MYVVLTRLLTQLNLICTTACNTSQIKKLAAASFFMLLIEIEFHTLLRKNSCKLVAMFLVS